MVRHATVASDARFRPCSRITSPVRERPCLCQVVSKVPPTPRISAASSNCGIGYLRRSRFGIQQLLDVQIMSRIVTGKWPLNRLGRPF